MEEYLWLSHRLELPGLLHAAKEAAVLGMVRRNSLHTLAALHQLAEDEDAYKEAAMVVVRVGMEELRETEAWAELLAAFPALVMEIQVTKTNL